MIKSRATYSRIPALELGLGVKTKEVRLEETGLNASVTRELFESKVTTVSYDQLM